MAQVAWTPQEHNQILKGEGFYISYNKKTGNDGSSNITDLMNLLGGLIGEEEKRDGEETALCILNGKGFMGTPEFLILEGDFRKEYEKAYPKGLEACKKVYKKNIEHRSNWSSD